MSSLAQKFHGARNNSHPELGNSSSLLEEDRHGFYNKIPPSLLSIYPDDHVGAFP